MVCDVKASSVIFLLLYYDTYYVNIITIDDIEEDNNVARDELNVMYCQLLLLHHVRQIKF